MKKLLFLLIAVSVISGLLPGCNSKQTAEDNLKDDSQRKEFVTTIAHNESYSREMMQEMMRTDSSKQMMGQTMMNDSGMMKMMMGNMMNMAEKDTAMCKKMMEMMEQKPTMMKMMKGMNMSTGSMYTCPMHHEIKSPTPGKCPKCGMDLVKRKDYKSMDKMKM